MGRGALISKFVFTYIILVILTARERNFDEFKLGGLHEKHAVATWNLGSTASPLDHKPIRFRSRKQQTYEELTEFSTSPYMAPLRIYHWRSVTTAGGRRL
jgi:hypothetical protein